MGQQPRVVTGKGFRRAMVYLPPGDVPGPRVGLSALLFNFFQGKKKKKEKVVATTIFKEEL